MIGATVVIALSALGAAAADDMGKEDGYYGNDDYYGHGHGYGKGGHYDDHGIEQLDQLETARLTQPAQRVEFGVDAFRFDFADPDVNVVIDNAAVLQQQVTKASNQFLSTLAEPGEAQFLTVLKPCGILLPHVHPRANEFYSVVFGIMDAGVSQENGFAQDLTFEVGPGQVFVAPQGLLHHNHNAQCFPNVFFQSFTSSDPGALNVIGALAAMNAGSDAGAAAILASGAELVEASPQGAFALDQVCLKRCGFPTTGAPDDGLTDLPDNFRELFGLDNVDDKDDGKKGKKDYGKKDDGKKYDGKKGKKDYGKRDDGEKYDGKKGKKDYGKGKW